MIMVPHDDEAVEDKSELLLILRKEGEDVPLKRFVVYEPELRRDRSRRYEKYGFRVFV